MNTTAAIKEPTDTSLSLVGTQNGIEYHKKIGEQLIASATHHFKAASHLQDGNSEKAAQCAGMAHEYFNIASETESSNSSFH
ncbi:MAG TPA: hypothetical protein VK783_13410 [Bacteroidia bacterium]|jgi:hypothetical protein|nr:hypothetical protein [Bacteroidia bacterium]